MDFFVDVVLPIPLERLFTYRLRAEAAAAVKPGMRIAVPFGKSKIYTALAYSVHQTPPYAYEAKEIHQVLDEYPIVTKIQMAHWQWLSEYYMCTLGEVVRSALPNALLLESETLIEPTKNTEYEESNLSDNEFLVLEALRYQSSLKIHDVAAILDRKIVVPIVHKMVAKQLVQLKETLQEKYRPKMVKYIRLSKTYSGETALERLLVELSRAKKQSEAVLAFFQLQTSQKSPIALKQLLTYGKVSRAVVMALIGKEVFELYEKQVDRIVHEANSKHAHTIQLSKEQALAHQHIEHSFTANKVCLLHGVTSSGKTEVYIKLIAKTIASGAQALYLLPEIALTSQLINRLKVYFGNQVAVYHSKYSIHERVEVWYNVLAHNDTANIVIGARSALFLPFKNLGLVVVDEEHEGSFKQFDPAPRYHARDAAVVLAQMHKANCLLGSATPSIESYKNAKSGKYGFAEMTKRYRNVLMPDMELVDIKEATRKKRMSGHFSERLLKEMTAKLENGAQIILFQNRRGFAPVVECTTCGHTNQCPNCDVSLTYHQRRNQLRCHYCGYHTAVIQVCPACGNTTLDTKGFGTEQLQEELLKLFPDEKVGRMDLDTTRGKYSYEKIITSFEQREISILVGTQMVTKGLDFRNVGLVGVMNADAMLNFPDYRALERSFQLMVQVAGRAGRTQTRGKVLIQTYNPYHPLLHQITNYDYKNMYLEQLYERELFKYPPHVRIIRITLKDRDYNKLNEAADWFATSLRNVFKTSVLGPEYPVISRIRNKYLKHILIKVPRNQNIAKTKNGIKRLEQSFNAISKYKSIRLVYDVDHI